MSEKLLKNGMIKTSKVLKDSVSKQVKVNKEITDLTGPFTLNPVHAMVGADVKATVSHNYQSATVGVFVSIPVDCGDEYVKEGLDYCFEVANNRLNEELEDVRKALEGGQ